MKKLGLHDMLETERFIMKIPEESEAESLWSLISDETTKYMVWDKSDSYEETLKSIISRREKAKLWENWESAIYDKYTWECIWQCGINKIDEKIPSFSLWYWISEKYYWKWIVPECVKRILKFVFEESSFEKWIITCDSQNINSWKVALKCWFELEWTLRKHERVKWKLRDTNYYGLTREKYFKV